MAFIFLRCLAALLLFCLFLGALGAVIMQG